MSYTNEEWKPVVGYERLYEVSSVGNVRRINSGKLTQRFDEFGYLRLGLSSKGIKRSFRVHTLVAYAFLGPRPDGLDINHIDGTKSNNRADNLEYITRKANCIHAVMNGLTSTVVTPQIAAHIKGLPKVIKNDTIARRFNTSPQVVNAIRKGKSWQHITRKFYGEE